MSGLPWLKMWRQFATEITVQELSFENQRHWVMILCLRCGTKEPVENPDSRISVFLRIGKKATADLKKVLMAAKMIDEFWNPVNWEKYQANGYVSTSRVQKYREKQHDW